MQLLFQGNGARGVGMFFKDSLKCTYELLEVRDKDIENAIMVV